MADTEPASKFQDLTKQQPIDDEDWVAAEQAKAEAVDVVWDGGTMVPRSVDTGIYTYRAGQIVSTQERVDGYEQLAEVVGLENATVAYVHGTDSRAAVNDGPVTPATVASMTAAGVDARVHHVCGITPYYMISEGDPSPVGRNDFDRYRGGLRRRVATALERVDRPDGERRVPNIGVIDTGYLCGEGPMECELERELGEAKDDNLIQHLDRGSDRLLFDAARVEGRPLRLMERAAGHGVFVASVIGHMATEAKLRFERVTGTVDGVVDEKIVCEQIIEAAKAEVDIINLSLGCYARTDEEPLLLRETLKHVLNENPDLVVVAAAGNDSSARQFFPAAFDTGLDASFERLISVGALDGVREAPYSNAGLWVDWYAPGTEVIGRYLGSPDQIVERENVGDGLTVPYAGYAMWSGTSYSAPYVTGLIARVMAEGGGSAAEAWQTISEDWSPDVRRQLRLLRGNEV